MIDLVDVRGVGDKLPLVGELDPYQLKATPSAFGDSTNHGVDDPYVPRTHAEVDQRVVSALGEDRLVVLVGPSKAGKTRTLFESVRRELPSARVVVPEPRSLADLPGCGQYRDHPDTLVVWLEDLDEFTRADRSLTPRLLAALTARRARTVVVATLRSEEYDKMRAGGEFARDIRTVFEQAIRIELAPTSASPVEQAAAALLYPSLDLTRYGLAEMLVGAPALLEHYRSDRRQGRVSTQIAAFAAVVGVVIDWARIGRSDRIPEERVIDLARDVIDTRFSAYNVTDDDLAAAIAAARLPFEGAGDTTAIDSKWLTDPRTRGYRPFDYLIAADDIIDRPIPDIYWHRATTDAEAEVRNEVGASAYYRGLHTTAETMFRHAVDLGDTGAMRNLGVLLEGRGDLDDAENWYRRAAELGHTDAMNNLGVLLEGRGDLGDAENWYQRAAELGHTDAITNLGVLLADRGILDDAENWYCRAAELGGTSSMHNLGVLLEGRGDLDDAENWYRRAAELGHTDAITNLGVLLANRSGLGDAENWWRHAADLGHTTATYNVGVLLAKRGEREEAENWYQRAAGNGHTSAMYNLGLLLADRGDLGDAENWWRRAAGNGETDAMRALGLLLWERGELGDAENWWRHAADLGHTIATYDLGLLLADRGEREEAENWYQRAAGNGHTSAMYNLGLLLANRGEREEAENWYQRAADLGDTDAMNNLGDLLADRGDLDYAENWWRHAVDLGHTGAMNNLGLLLANRGERGEAECWWRRAADLGHTDVD
ncbi:tetratricopeptide repeat protein [Nocardia salmonicida]|uniref:tetratricopeptide repeat protein n=1 Tax=Nocardia salmonicida TaxID=53431 RepID=UPI0037A00FDB